MSQQTIAEKISCTGIGLHSGEPVQMTLYPARADSGVVFVRSDLSHPVEIPARYDAITACTLATSIGCGDVTISTVEHLLSALYALGIDNVRVEVDAAELPIMDGSAAPFVHLLRSAGAFHQSAPRRRLRIVQPLEVREGARFIRIEPGVGGGIKGLSVSYSVDFEHPAIGRQSLEGLSLDAECFERDIARARTFGFLRDVQALWNQGRALGGDFDNAVVLDDERVLNAEGLRWPDEFVRHKVLDLIGDLALLDHRLEGRVTVCRGGHKLHQQLLRAIARNPQAWVIEADEALRAPLHPVARPERLTGVLAHPAPPVDRPERLPERLPEAHGVAFG